jgi:hypothetical protein
LQLSASSVVQISQVLHSFRFLGGSQSATCNKTVVLFSGEGDYLRMIVNIGCDGDLTAFNVRQLYPLRFQLSLDGFPCVISRKGHNSSVAA